MFGRGGRVDTRRSMAPSDDRREALDRSRIDEVSTSDEGARSAAVRRRGQSTGVMVPSDPDRSATTALGIDPLDARSASVLLRHARSPARPGRRRGAGAADPGAGERLDREAASGRAGRSARRGAQVAQPRGRGRRDEGFARVLGLDEAHLAPDVVRSTILEGKPIRKLFSGAGRRAAGSIWTTDVRDLGKVGRPSSASVEIPTAQIATRRVSNRRDRGQTSCPLRASTSPARARRDQ